MAKSPVAILFTTDGVEVGVKDGLSLPANARGFISVGYDGANTQFILVDSSGRQQVVGAAAAGAAVAGNPVLVGGTDGTNVQVPKLFDADTGGGTEFIFGISLRKASSGGSVELGTSTDPIRTDPTGTTTQPISAASLPLPTGAATEATLATRLAEATFTARINTLGQKAMTASTPVVLASDQSAIPVTDNGGSLTVDGTVAVSSVGGTVDVSDRAGRLVGVVYGSQGQQLKQTATNFNLVVESAVAGSLIDPRSIRALTNADVVTAEQGAGAAATASWATRLSDGTVFYDAAKTGQLPSSLVGGRLDTNTGAWLGSTAPTVGQKAMASSIPIVVASDQTPIPVSVTGGLDRTSTGTISSTENVAVSTQGSGACGIQISGTWTGTIVFEATVDGSTWNPVDAEVPTTGTEASSTTTNGVWIVACAGYSQVRVRGNTVATGTASVFLSSSTASHVVILGEPLPAGSNVIGGVTQSGAWTVTSNQGNAGSHAQRWMVGLSDGSGFISPATDRTTAAAPFAFRLSDGSAFYDAAKTGQLPSALVGGRLDINTGSWLGSTAPTVGQKAMAASIPIAIASDQSVIPVSQSGTWTVQQGTPPWSVSQSGTWTVQQGTPPWSVVGPGASGAAVSGNPVRIAFSDGTNTRDALSDASGRLQVVGAAASGAAAAGNPVLAAGSDGTNARTIRTATDGTVRVDPTGTTAQPVTDNGGSLTVDGTVTADQGNQGSHAQRWMVGLSDGSGFISPATDRTTAAAPFSVRLSDGSAFYTAPNAGQLPSVLVGGRLDTNIGAWLGSTAPSVGQKTAANSIPIVIASDQSAVPVSQSGTWTVQQGTPPWSVVGAAADGAAPSGNPVLVAGQDGTNVQSLKTDTTGRPEVVGAAAVGAAVAGNPVLMGGSDGTNARYVSVDTSGRLVMVQATASLLNATVTQGPAAALSGYWPVRVTDGTNTMPTMDVAARAAFQRVTDGTNTAAVKAASTAAATTDPSLVVALSPNTPPQPPADRTASGTLGALNATVSISTVGLGVVGIDIAGTWVATISFEGTIDGSNWFATNAFPMVTGGASVTSTTANGQWRVLTSGLQQVRVRATLYTSGTATITMEGAATSSTVRSAQGAPNTLANAWTTQLTDATTGPVAVKPASTAAVASDKALVVILSPNQQAIPVSSTPATASAGLRAGTVLLGGGTSGTLNIVRATTYNEQSADAQRSVASSSTNDTSAGTGARTIEITYYTSTGSGPFTETVTLNGTTAVNTTNTNICFIESMIVKTAGSTGSNAGTITLYVSTGGTGGTIGTIGVGSIVALAGDGRTLWAHHYVASSRNCSVTGIAFGASAASTFHLRAKSLTANAAEIPVSELLTTTNGFQRSYGSPIVVAGPARIAMYGVPSTNNVTLNASMDFFET